MTLKRGPNKGQQLRPFISKFRKLATPPNQVGDPITTIRERTLWEKRHKKNVLVAKGGGGKTGEHEVEGDSFHRPRGCNDEDGWQ